MRSIRIPKVDPDKYYNLKIYKGGLNQTNYITFFKLKEQVVDGLTLPKNLQCSAFNNQVIFYLIGPNPTVDIIGEKLNEILKTVWIDCVRNGEYD